MYRAAVAFAILAGCTEPAGLTIDVLATDGVTRVELFIAQECSGRCPARVGPPSSAPMTAELFEVQHDATWSEPIEGGVAGFRIVTDADETQTIALLAAVGYNGDAAVATALIKHIDVEPSAADYIRIQLAPATPLDPQTDPPDGTFRIAQWSTKSSPLPSCVVIERGHGGATERVAIGPVTDTDCDEVAQQPECAPWAYLATDISGSIATANCTLSTSVTCVAAAPSCSEVGNQGGSCGPIAEEYCLPAPLCSCPPWDVTCLEPKILVEGSYLKCIVPTVNISTVPCNDPTNFDAVDVCSYLAGTSAKCTDVRIHELDDTIGPFDTNADFGTSKLVIKRFAAPGLIDLEWSGTPEQQTALLSLDLDNGRHLVLPLVVGFGGPCSTPACDIHVGAADSGLACASTPPASACAPTQGCITGPLCGTVCCLNGEACVNGVCQCGPGPACEDGWSCHLGQGPSCGSGCCGGPNNIDCGFLIRASSDARRARADRRPQDAR